MLDLAVIRDSVRNDLPSDGDFARWAEAALHGVDEPVELAIRLVDEADSQELNRKYRDKDQPTNVLSFPSRLPDFVIAELDFRPLGDLAICAPLVAAEALEQDKQVVHHWAHLTVHGVLHLLGHDHVEEADAVVMEALERKILASLDIPDPY